MELEVLLQAHADVGIALAGFASVVAALRRPLSVLARHASFRPARRLGVAVQNIMNPVVGRLVWGAGLAGMLLLLLNIVGLPLRPGFDLYYAGLLVTLPVGFVLFADAAVGES
jgi:hypothetical protein